MSIMGNLVRNFMRNFQLVDADGNCVVQKDGVFFLGLLKFLVLLP
jgi:hypothetical protein